MIKLWKVKERNKKVSHRYPKTEDELLKAGWIRMPKAEEIQRMEAINEKIPQEVKDEVERIIMEQFKEDIERGHLGLCHRVWAVKKRLYAARGYEWYSPKERHPEIMFD